MPCQGGPGFNSRLRQNSFYFHSTGTKSQKCKKPERSTKSPVPRDHRLGTTGFAYFLETSPEPSALIIKIPTTTRNRTQIAPHVLAWEEVKPKQDNEGPPSLEYWWNLPNAHAAYESGDASFFWSKSTDGGVSCPFLEKGTKAILAHDAVISELKSYCQRWTSGMLLDIF